MPHGRSPRHERKPRKSDPPTKDSSAGRRRGRRPAPDPTRAPGSADDSASGADPSGGAAEHRSVRLQKLLAQAGFGSRREVERFLIEERVTVNGRVARLGDGADPALDEIRLDGERLLRERPAYWLVHKPRGVVTTVRDEAGRRTVMDLLPRNVGRVFPVGRLDRETSGLLLLTNDGDVAHALLHPSLGNEREYRVSVKGELDPRAVTRIERGVNLEEGRTAPGRVADLRFDPDGAATSFSLTLVEGRKRQIRRSLLLLGFPVRRLTRVRMGPLRLGRLAVGEARPLRAAERRALLEHVRRLRAGEPPLPEATTRPTGRAPTGKRSGRPGAGGAKAPGRGAARSKPKGAAKAKRKGAGAAKRKGGAEAKRKGGARTKRKGAAKAPRKGAAQPDRKGATRSGPKGANRSDPKAAARAKSAGVKRTGGAKKKPAAKPRAGAGPRRGAQRPNRSRKGTSR